MRARLRRLLLELSEAFWVLPAAIVLVLAGLGLLVVDLQLEGDIAHGPLHDWVYGGGETGARTLLGAVASSTIGVAGTLFSITIAALSLASSQMGPRLLRNFVRDRGNQITLGVLLGTFAYALVVLRSVRGGANDAFVPALGVTVALALSGACIGLLIYFVHHVATRINVDTVIDLVHDDIDREIDRLTEPRSERRPPPAEMDWTGADEVRLEGSGYLQQIDAAGLAKWAADAGTTVRLLIRPGAFVFPGATVALVKPRAPGAAEAIREATALSPRAGGGGDLVYSILQLVEVAVRALSPGINDPRTAISVLDRLGAILGRLVDRDLRDGVVRHADAPRLLIPSPAYGDLTGAMFAMIRQSAGHSPTVLLHMLGVLRAVAEIETRAERIEALRQVAAEVAEEGRGRISNPCDVHALDAAHRAFLTTAAARCAG
ncbi:MAG: DUF2254 domain-containing protein [Phenylobacterium sp.]|uniref:DUF2254 domain-containing protein n=1 Tax=Phenylobacterium sp. TaxID=1871053 RepID=UPI0025DFD00F|nr:DUF2254 domain-containing protein [Phenylobacterium sp.]MBI1198066.1 DUF2254 domain-containing protein [Phenylobacterium sp.]